MADKLKLELKNSEQIELMRESVLLVSRTLAEVAKVIRVGMTGLELDKLAEEFIHDHGGKPSFKGYRGTFPGSLCISVNEQVIHGIPNDRPFESGDIVSVDCGVYKNGYHGDHAYTFALGDVKPEVLKLLEVTKESLYLGIEHAIAGKRIGDIGFAIQQHAEQHGFTVVREFCGHGVGRSLHELPDIPNHGKRGKGKKIQNGMTLAIEPMINLGRKDIRQLDDKWTVVTADGLPSAHFEHNVAIIDGKPEILSNYELIESVWLQPA